LAASSSIPPSKPAGTPEGGAGPYVIGIVVLLAAGGGLYWWKSQAPEAKTEPTAAASTPVKSAEPPKPQFAPPPPPPPEEEDAGADAGDDAGPAASSSAKVAALGGGKGPCQKCGEGKPSSALTSAIRSTAQGAQGCYNRALRQGEASGQMTVSVSVGSTGSVCGASIASDSVGSAEISSCVLGRFRGKTFPPPDEGCVVVNVPINFVAK
jgi:outer membrane biosynthesis protein TonB